MFTNSFFLTGKYHDDETNGDHITFTARFGPFKASFKVYMPAEGENTCDVECMPGMFKHKPRTSSEQTPDEATNDQVIDNKPWNSPRA